jgi:hypothetical protein
MLYFDPYGTPTAQSEYGMNGGGGGGPVVYITAFASTSVRAEIDPCASSSVRE